jgi:alpha-mannosidase
MRITEVESTCLFVGSQSRPLQIIRVTLEAGARDLRAGTPDDAAVSVRIEGNGLGTASALRINGFSGGTFEVPVAVGGHVRPGTAIPVMVIAESDTERTERADLITAAEPGWTMWMVSHFHYDPVWWSTQGQFTEARLVLPDEEGKLADVRTAFELVQVHLEKARRDRDYKFVLAEIDYLKPYFDVYPADRAQLASLLAAGRVEIVGGNYNEPNTNLTSAETTVRNAVYGMGYQRDVLGGDPRSAWMLDVFGHDPGYPGLMAAAGLTSTSWARGPFHQWGPDDNAQMQFPSEFEWVSPDGNGLLTGYMANHYGAGWALHTPGSLHDAEQAAYRQFTELAPVSATPNVLLPVGADHVIPARWVTDIHRSWNARYVWPRFVTAIPRDFFDAVRRDARERDVWITPQTRDMNPVYTGKDVSYIDTKQAHRAAEVAVSEGERLAAVASLTGHQYPHDSLDRAWRLLAYGAHHDAITGTESDQVYLDLLGGWREAWDLGNAARRDAADHLAGGQDVGVVNGLGRERSGLATVTVTPPPGSAGVAVRDGDREVPALAEGVRRRDDGSLAEVTLTFPARAVPGLASRGFRLAAAGSMPGEWTDIPGASIENAAFAVTADPSRGGTVSITDKRTGLEVLRGPGNELVLQEEYDKHPRWGEGPWHLSPRGPGIGSAAVQASVRAQRCPVGARLIATFRLGDLSVTAETLLWDGAERVEFRTHVDGSIGRDRLLRVRFPADVPGGLPVYQTATAVIGRPFGDPEADTATRWFTLDNPAWQWFGLGAVASVEIDGLRHAIGVAEVIPPINQNGHGDLYRDLLCALARTGVTATCSRADGPRCGDAAVDSGLPDVRLSVGGPDTNPFTAEVLASSPEHAKRLAALVAEHGSARLWVPSAGSRSSAYTGRGSESGPDLRGTRDLPVLIVAGRDGDALAEEVFGVIADLGDGVVSASGCEGDVNWAPPVTDRAVALFNRGTPSGVVSVDGTLWMSLMRSCSSWPSGVWIDGDRRFAPDGSSFAWQHWSHTFEYALAAGGSWHSAGFNAAAEDYNHPLLAVPSSGAGPAGSGSGAGSAVSVSPANVTLAALKPYGNPLASGRPGELSGDLTVRLHETDGRATTALVRVEGGISAAWLTDLLETSRGARLEVRDGTISVDVPAFGTVTIAVSPGGTIPPKPASPGGAIPPKPPLRTGDYPPPVTPGGTPAGPEYARYWLHGTGPAPIGNLPVAVHVTPTRVALPSAADSATVRVSVACGPSGATGSVELAVPDGIVVHPAGSLPYSLEPGGHLSWDLTVRATARAGGGRYFVAARDSGRGVEDTVLVAVGEAAPPDRDTDPEELFFRLQSDHVALTDEVELAVLDEALELAPGSRGELRVRVTSRLASELRGSMQLLSPFGSWEATQSWLREVRADPRGTAEVTFPVSVPASARTGEQFWLLVKLMYFGRVRYSRSVPVVIV